MSVGGASTLTGDTSAADMPRGALSSLRRLALIGAAWILGATLVRQGLRLGGSLVLTRLLFPEAFGLMAIVGFLMAAVEMCSDFGIRQALVQNPSGDRPRYLGVAWTLIVVRGLILSFVVAVLAWPFSALFHEPQLVGLVLLASLNPILGALTSPGRLVWQRELRQDRITQLQLAVDVWRLAANICGAMFFRSVWGLALAALSAEIVRLVASYWMFPFRPALVWDRSIARELIRFGRFVFVSTLLGFLALRLDSFFVAKYLGMESIGIYYIALALATPLETIGSQLVGGLLFPALARRQHDQALVRRRMGQAIAAMLLVGLPFTGLIAVASPLVVAILYDARYAAAGEALRWLILGAFLSCFGNTLNARLMAAGKPQAGTLATIVRLGVFCACAVLLAQFGVGGYAAATAISALAFFLVVLYEYARRNPAASSVVELCSRG